MKINKKLNLVIPFEGGVIHAMPISRMVFEKYYRVIAQTFAEMYSPGAAALSGPKIAALLLKDVAVKFDAWEGDEGVERGLMNEIRRLSNVAIVGNEGWQTFTYYDACKQSLLDEDQVAEIESLLVFFMCVSSMQKQRETEVILGMVNALWGSQTTLLAFTEYINSLRTSTGEGNSGEKAIV